MIRIAYDIMIKDFRIVNPLVSIRKIKNIIAEKGTNFFIVKDYNEQIVGVITNKELIDAHPNRISADAMTDNYFIVTINTSIWEIKELFLESNYNILLVREHNEIVGIVNKSVLDIELGKHTDLLTGLYKKDYIFYNTSKLINYGYELSIIFIDVNEFGLIDKRYGHIVGDKILQELAFILDNHKPDNTYLCRFGGDEFILLTPFYLDEAEKVARKIIDDISTHKFTDNIKVTISVGIAGGRRHKIRVTDIYSTVTSLVNIASIASTDAKKSKTNLCVSHRKSLLTNTHSL